MKHGISPTTKPYRPTKYLAVSKPIVHAVYGVVDHPTKPGKKVEQFMGHLPLDAHVPPGHRVERVVTPIKGTTYSRTAPKDVIGRGRRRRAAKAAA